MSTITITEFLEARIAEDEAVARAVTCGPHWEADPESYIVLHGGDGVCYDVASEEVSQHITRHDPARVLAEYAAKRAIISHYDETVKWCRDPDCPAVQSYSDIAVGLGESLRHLAAVYADHPDYRQEWAL